MPRWAEDETSGRKLNNARPEGLADKPSCRQSVRRRGCIIPASGFYEWQAVPAARGGKQPWHLSPRGDRCFAFAGLTKEWQPSSSADDRAWVLTCCIVTTAPHAPMACIHDRMPVILPREHCGPWLKPNQLEPAFVAPLLHGLPADTRQA